MAHPLGDEGGVDLIDAEALALGPQVLLVEEHNDADPAVVRGEAKAQPAAVLGVAVGEELDAAVSGSNQYMYSSSASVELPLSKVTLTRWSLRPSQSTSPRSCFSTLGSFRR